MLGWGDGRKKAKFCLLSIVRMAGIMHYREVLMLILGHLYEAKKSLIFWNELEVKVYLKKIKNNPLKV